MTAREYRTIDKSTWGDGPWQSEPDKRQWTDAATGLPCLIVRSGFGGNLCGYVGVPSGHLAHGQNYSAWSYSSDGEELPLSATQNAINEVEVHGGLTYAGGCQHEDDERLGICHVPELGTSDTVWWFGFDCAHGGDLSPARPELSTWFGECSAYRDVAYVTEQCKQLAAQLAAIAP